MEFQEVIAHRRDGVGNSKDELEAVAQAAADYGAEAFKASDEAMALLRAGDPSKLAEENGDWLDKATAAGRTCLDIGPDFARKVHGLGYQWELDHLDENYPRTPVYFPPGWK